MESTILTILPYGWVAISAQSLAARLRQVTFLNSLICNRRKMTTSINMY